MLFVFLQSELCFFLVGNVRAQAYPVIDAAVWIEDRFYTGREPVECAGFSYDAEFKGRLLPACYSAVPGCMNCVVVVWMHGRQAAVIQQFRQGQTSRCQPLRAHEIDLAICIGCPQHAGQSRNQVAQLRLRFWGVLGCAFGHGILGEHACIHIYIQEKAECRNTIKTENAEFGST